MSVGQFWIREEPTMAVRLQTADGKIKKYRVTQVLFAPCGDGGSCIDKYVTKCGREWKPGAESQACDHLDCAIYAAESDRKEKPEVFMFLIVLAAAVIIIESVIGWRQMGGFAIMFSGALTLLAFWFLFGGLKEGKRFRELTEYRDKRTINGIAAWQIFGDQEKMQARHWWQFWQ
jgi:hypothetical protein